MLQMHFTPWKAYTGSRGTTPVYSFEDRILRCTTLHATLHATVKSVSVASYIKDTCKAHTTIGRWLCSCKVMDMTFNAHAMQMLLLLSLHLNLLFFCNMTVAASTVAEPIPLTRPTLSSFQIWRALFQGE